MKPRMRQPPPELEAYVKEFMERQPRLRALLAPAPCNRAEDVVLSRLRHMLEELHEYAEAAEREDLVETADALGDLLYLVLGTFLVHGIPVRPVIREIHRSNMTKADLNEQMKGGKGDGFIPPGLTAILGVKRS